MNDFFKGLKAYSRSFSIIFQNGLAIYLILPGLISLLLGTIILSLAWVYAGDLGGLLSVYYPWEFGKAFVDGLASLLSGLVVLVTAFLLLKHIIMILVSPFMSVLSEKVERILYNTSPAKISTAEAIKDLLRGLRLSLRNIVYELMLILPCFLLYFIPFFGTIGATILIFIIQAYYAGFGNMDYTLERKLSLKGRIDFVRYHKGAAISNGGVFMALFLFVPIIGLMIAPALSTVSSTIYVLEQLEKEGI